MVDGAAQLVVVAVCRDSRHRVVGDRGQSAAAAGPHRLESGAGTVRHRGGRARRRRGRSVAAAGTRPRPHRWIPPQLFLGWLWPLWDRAGTDASPTCSLRTEVHRALSPSSACASAHCDRGDRGRCWWPSLAATLGYFGGVPGTTCGSRKPVNRWPCRVPRSSKSMLSYDAATLQADFERARGLVTDGYREQLVTQQEAIHKRGRRGVVERVLGRPTARC